MNARRWFLGQISALGTALVLPWKSREEKACTCGLLSRLGVVSKGATCSSPLCASRTEKAAPSQKRKKHRRRGLMWASPVTPVLRGINGLIRGRPGPAPSRSPISDWTLALFRDLEEGDSFRFARGRVGEAPGALVYYAFSDPEVDRKDSPAQALDDPDTIMRIEASLMWPYTPRVSGPLALQELADHQRRAEEIVGLDQPHCIYARPGRGDCEHAVGFPGLEWDVDHDGPRTEDCYGRPNGWCWHCWHTFQIEVLQGQVGLMRNSTWDGTFPRAPSEKSLHVAARVWCDPEMVKVEMDEFAARRIAQIVEEVIG